MKCREYEKRDPRIGPTIKRLHAMGITCQVDHEPMVKIRVINKYLNEGQTRLLNHLNFQEVE